MSMSNGNCPNKHKIKFLMQVPSEVSESHASTNRVHSQSGNPQLRLLPFEMQVPLLKRRAPHMHAHVRMGTQRYTHITSSLLARAACWVTVNAFCAFLIYFLCNDKVEMSFILRTVFFKQKGEWRGTTLQRQKNALISQVYDFSQSSSRMMLFTIVTLQNPQEAILSPCWVFSINPVSLSFASTDHFFFKALHVDVVFRQKCKPPSLDCAFLSLPGLTFPENFRFDVLQVTVDTWPASKGRDHAIGVHVLESAHPEGFLLESVTILDGDFPVEGRAHLMR